MTFICTILGGSAAWPNPGQGCSSYLLDSGSTRLLLDCGPDTLLQLRRHCKLSEVNAIVVSHCHADHILDLITYRYGMVYSPDQTEHRIPIWLPPGGGAILRSLGSILGSQSESSIDFWDDVFEILEYDPESSLTIGQFKIDFAATQHFTPCFAMRVTLNHEQSLVYGADTGNFSSLVEFTKGAGVLIAEATSDSHNGTPLLERGHLIPEDAGAWAAAANVERLIVTHLWNERSPSEVVRRAASKFQGPIDVAMPGLTIYV